MSYLEQKVAYRRGRSTIYVAFEDLHDAYATYRGEILDSSTLRAHKPRVFDSKQGGHSCNCTFLFMLVKELGVVDCIHGAGKRGSRFWVELPG